MSSRVCNASAPAAHVVVGPETYSRWRETTLGAVTEALEHRLLHRLVSVIEGKRVLDLGCGDGLFTWTLATRGARAVGIDIDRRMLRAAAARATRARVPSRFVEGRVEHLPFRDGAFDVVVAVTVLCLVDDIDTAAREAVRVLRPGGRLVIGDLGRWSTWAAVRRVRGWLGAPTWKRAHFSTAAELRALIESLGVSVDIVRGSVYYPPVAALARLMAPADHWLGALTTAGAAFIGVAGNKNGGVDRSSRTALSQTASGLPPTADFEP
ncbi:MAG: hypothetical protein A3G76_11150 [Acidobacteria bacterium RIFCSPLOWO2_12_FULL_65_11]|nr:MAG: hypothetical protein A3H95_18505 [Acidobacteria bacterium RIFCSPLOWO2_02_FULL_64_15]OFW30615.1 MAG: hypothetical protein A3G76_11150 [Acidobacteria bacterium RIFCSPLOWO2_12_FULL_65_11]